jgi:formylmethanofuran dehydrogenase subunit E
LAKTYAPQAESRWRAYLLGYQRMPDEELLDIREVTLSISVAELLSKDGYRVNCDRCGEEIINEREVVHEGLTLCRACAGGRYYYPANEKTTASDRVQVGKVADQWYHFDRNGC